MANSYCPHTDSEVRSMLREIGLDSIDGLFREIPGELREQAGINVAGGISEQELRRQVEALAAGNASAGSLVQFAGAGCYPHFIPAAVRELAGRSEFTTAYTPYQPEVSQGTLQAAFEFQSIVAALTGMDVANASMYDGASAAAEAVLMAHRLLPEKPLVAVSKALHPQYLETIETYVGDLPGLSVTEVPFTSGGTTDLGVAAACLDRACCLVIGYPNFLGVVDDLAAASRLAHERGACMISVTHEALALALLKSPGGLGADVAVGEGQSLGLSMSYGGPGVGLFACRQKFVRSMPGRVVGETRDEAGRRGYVLTLATREQHIRRERATSNICTNNALCALAVTVYVSLLGEAGLREVAERNSRSASYLRKRLASIGRLRFEGTVFNEFVIELPAARDVWERLLERGIMAGVPLGTWFHDLDCCLLICATEVHTREEMDRLCHELALAVGDSD